MLHIFVIILTVLFALKLLWNILTPLIAERRLDAWKREGGNKPSSVSMVLGVELILWILLIISSALSREDWWISHTMDVFIYGGCAIVASYILAAFVGIFARRP
jgi:hypothetical protein